MRDLLPSHLNMKRALVVLALLITLLAVCHPALAQGERIIFLHHSCGANLIAQGGVREGFTARGYEFYDHGYNEEGLVLADGTVPVCRMDFRAEEPAGSIAERSVEELWTAGRIAELRAEQGARKFDGFGLCPRCRDWDNV